MPSSSQNTSFHCSSSL